MPLSKISILKKIIVAQATFFSRKFKGIRMIHKECKEIKGIRKETIFFPCKKENLGKSTGNSIFFPLKKRCFFQRE